MARKLVWGLLCSALFLLLVSSPAVLYADQVTFADFSSTAGLQLNGSAVQSGTALQLTSAGQFFVAGSAFTLADHSVANGFSTTFQFQITPGTLFNGSPADGLAFVIQNSSPTALGGAGGGPPTGLGYGGILNSLAIEFDTYPFNTGDPATPHVAIQSCGTAANSTDNSGPCNLGKTAGLAFADSLVHTVKINYAPGIMTVNFDGSNVLSSAVNLGSLLNLSGGSNAFLGFTGSTGAATETADVLNWQYQSVPEPATILLLGSGLGLLGVLKKRRNV